MIRTAIVILGGVLSTVYYASKVVLLHRLGSKRLTCQCDDVARRWSRSMAWLAAARIRIDGAERVDWKGPMVLVSNHQSWFDVWALAGFLPTNLRFVAKEELGRIPIFGPAWKACGHISVNRSDHKQSVGSLDRAAERVRNEKLAVALFPEGTRSRDGRLQPFRKGAFVLAIQTGVPVVPIGISGSRAVMPKGSFRVRSGEIRIRVGEPIPTMGLSHEDRDRLLATCRSAVVSLMEDPDGEAALNVGDTKERTA